MDVDEDPWSDDEAVICIPFSPHKEDAHIRDSHGAYPSNVKTDLSHGPQERYKLYSETWDALQTQVKEAARRMYAPVLVKVLEVIQSPDKDTDTRKTWVQKLMPSRELPVALVVGDDKQEIFDEIGSEVTRNDDLVLSILTQSHFTSLQVALRGMIDGFVRSHDEKKRRTATAVATHDMQLLCSWYTWISAKEKRPKLVVLIQDIEICNASIVHDLFHVCSKYAEQLPFTFILGVSSSDVMTTMFSRATRTLLSVKRFIMPSEHQMFESMVQELFFKASTFPSLVLSGATASWLYHSWSSYHGSLNALVSHLQLIYIRHFQNPLTILWGDPLMGIHSTHDQETLAKDPTANVFLQHLAKALELNDERIEGIFESVGIATAKFRLSIQRAKYAFLILREVQAYLRDLSSQQHAIEFAASFAGLAEQFGQGKLDDICSRLLKRVRLLDKRQLHGLLERVVQSSAEDEGIAAIAADSLGNIEALRLSLAASQQTDEESRLKHALSEDLATLLDQLWQSMASWRALPLSQVWKTSDTDLPIDILNPSMRASVLNSLMYPGEYLLHDLDRYRSPVKSPKKKTKGQDVVATKPSVVDPDICILFSRYVNAGRTINIYDWFESFVQGVETTRTRKASPQKGKGKGKGKAAVVDDDEAWRREVYGRFMWAVHEMDMLGLLRWNGRGAGKKGAECAGKVVWVTPDDS